MAARGKYTTTVSEQRLGKYIPAETNTHATRLTVRNGVFSMWSVPRCYEQDSLKQPVKLSSAREDEKR
jgi:hypothetical protein